MQKSSLFYLFFFFVVPSAYSQDDLPDINIVSSQFEQIKIIQMTAGTDMLQGFKKAIKENNIKNAVILTGIGSVTDYHVHVVSDKNLPPAHEYPKASVAMDLTSVQGYIMDGRVHAHITLADENSMVGGHLEPGTKALTFFIITIGILADDIDISKLDKYKK